jgi:hypothetical protein
LASAFVLRRAEREAPSGAANTAEREARHGNVDCFGSGDVDSKSAMFAWLD